MLYRILTLLLFVATFAACDSGTAERTTDDAEKVTTSSPDGVNAKDDGTSTWEDQSARSSITANSADYDGEGTSPAQRADEPDTLKYIQTPESMSTSPVKKKAASKEDSK